MTIDKNDKAINYTDKILKIGSKNEQEGSTENFKSYSIRFNPPTGVVILHPSFLCPVIKNPDDPLILFVLADNIFFNTYEKSEGKNGNLAGPTLGGAVNRYLKIVDWENIDKTCPADEPIFPTNEIAMDNIDVYYLWQFADLKDRVLTNKENKPFGMIHPKVMDMYKKEGLVHGFEIVIQNFTKSEGLYDLSWMHYTRSDEDQDGKGYFYEKQDKLINNYNREFRQNLDAMPLSCSVEDDLHPIFSEEETTLQSYHPVYITSKKKLDFGHLSDVHVSSRQTVFTKSKARLIDRAENDTGSPVSEDIGSLVNTCYSSLKNLMEQLGNEVDLLIFTGDLIDYNRNFNPNNSENGIDKLSNSAEIWKALNLDDLLNKKRYPPGIDNLMMYELFQWYYKTFKKPILLTSGNHEAYTLPYGISPRAKVTRSIASNGWMFSRLQTVDEVIRNSVLNAQKDKEEIAKKNSPDIYTARANEGIPADHNLTITEAILMYGPDYARLVMDASSDNKGKRGFKPQNLEWFYKVFTPLSSFTVSHGDQCFIGLEWGEDERMISPTLFQQGYWTLNGFLPRSTDGVSDDQYRIVETALEKGKTCNVLCAHFTFVNFNNDRKISEIGEVNYSSGWTTHGKFDYGTFEKNRKKMYKLVVENKFQYTLSGHSHRSALYQITDGDTSLLRYNLAAQGQSAKADPNQAKKDLLFDPKDNLCRIMVVGCGGPIGVQNHQNEFFNWGFDTPTGHYVKFSGTKESKVGVKIPEIPQAKPRLAVSMEYADVFLRDDDKKGLFELIESDEDDGSFTMTLHEKANLPEADIIDKVTLYVYVGNNAISVEGVITSRGKNAKGKVTYTLDFKDNFYKLMEDHTDFKFVSLIRFSFKEPSSSILQNYSHNSGWIYPTTVINRQNEALKQYDEALESAGSYDPLTAQHHRENIIKNVKGYTIERHKTFGEVPDFDWYKRKFNHEYT